MRSLFLSFFSMSDVVGLHSNGVVMCVSLYMHNPLAYNHLNSKQSQQPRENPIHQIKESYLENQ